MKKLTSVYAMAACFGISALVAGCGGGDSSSGEAASLSLGVSDAPLDGADEVVMVFDQIELSGPDGERHVFAVCDDVNDDDVCEPKSADNSVCEFKDDDLPLQVDLLKYQGSEVFTLLNDVELPSGEYQWMRVRICNGDGTVLRSHVKQGDDIVPLVVKRGQGTEEGEIQLDKFVLATGENQFVAEFDLRRSLVDPQNKNDDSIYLKPRGVRLSNTVEVGHIAGEVSEALRDACVADYPDGGDPQDNSFSHVVYLYSGDIGLDSMDDDADQPEEGLTLPLATAAVVYDESSETYGYGFGFVAEGEYSLGYSCLAHNDQPESNEADDVAIYSAYGPVTVTANQTTVQDLDLPTP